MALALLVIVSHSFAFSWFGREPVTALTEGQHSLGEIAVAMFFLLSGFLITRSSLRSRSIGRFLWHRCLRIFPGYWVCLLVTALVFAPFYALASQDVFVRDPLSLLLLDFDMPGRAIALCPWDSARAYVMGNAAMFHFNGLSISGIMNLRPATIGGVLSASPHPWSINGSLWSLPYEFACYLALAGLAVAGGLRRGRLAIVVLFVGLWALYAFSCLDPEYFQRCFPYRCLQLALLLTLYFSAGCVCYLYREQIPVSKVLFAASLILMAAGLTFGSFGLVAPIAMSYAFMSLAFRLPIRHFDARGDFSYGTYIYAFPVQQGLAMLHVHEAGFVVFLTSTVLITLLLAVLSYRWVEAPCLKLKSIDPAAFVRKHLSRSQDALPAALVPEPAD